MYELLHIYCMTKVPLPFCALCQNLITFSHNDEKAVILGEFSDWKKCHEKLKKHSRCKFHPDATEKVLLFEIREVISL